MIAQGEKNEEIVVGLMIGIALDLMYSIFLLVRNKYKIITSILVFHLNKMKLMKLVVLFTIQDMNMCL